MLKTERLTESLSVAPQITLDDLKMLRDLGFKSIINNRPDGEAPGQPDSDTVAKACQLLGLEYDHLPVISGNMSSSDCQHFDALLKKLPKPTLAYCRSGTRSSMLWVGTATTESEQKQRIAHAHLHGFSFSPDSLTPLTGE